MNRQTFSHYDTVYSRRMNTWVERPVFQSCSLTTEEIISIMEKYEYKTQMTLTPPESAREFWHTLVYDTVAWWVYNEDTKKWEYDYDKYCNSDTEILHHLASDFAGNDDLAILNKQGKLLKRFAKYVKKETGHDVDSNTMGKLGDKLQYYISKDTNLIFDFVQGIDWDDGMFGHSGSCWWGEYADSVPTFNAGGGWALRFYESMTDRNGCGRTWIVPKYNAIIGFNSYGVERPQVVKLLTQIFQSHGIALTFRDQKVYNSQGSNIPYINSGTGFVMYENDTDIDLYSVNIDFDIEYSEEGGYRCNSCNDRLSDDESFYSEIDGCDYCESCYSERFNRCEECDEETRNDDMVRIQDSNRYTDVCESCAQDMGAVKCEDCDKWNVDNYHIAEDGDNTYCSDCFKSHVEFTCEECGCEYEYTDGCESCGTGSCAPAEESTEDDTEEESNGGESRADNIRQAGESVVERMDDVNLYLKNELVVHNIRYWIIPSIPGLFVYNYHDVDSDGQGYYVIHSDSGLAGSSKIKTRALALEYMRRIGPLRDWTLNKDSLNLTEVSTQVYEIRKELGIS